MHCVTLDDILENRVPQCDLIKMDCEGAEEDIMEHVRESNLRKVKSIIMEYHAGVDVDRIRNKLERVGFKVDISAKTLILFASRDEFI